MSKQILLLAPTSAQTMSALNTRASRSLSQPIQPSFKQVILPQNPPHLTVIRNKNLINHNPSQAVAASKSLSPFKQSQLKDQGQNNQILLMKYIPTAVINQKITQIPLYQLQQVQQPNKTLNHCIDEKKPLRFSYSIQQQQQTQSALAQTSQAIQNIAPPLSQSQISSNQGRVFSQSPLKPTLTNPSQQIINSSRKPPLQQINQPNHQIIQLNSQLSQQHQQHQQMSLNSQQGQVLNIQQNPQKIIIVNNQSVPMSNNNSVGQIIQNVNYINNEGLSKSTFINQQSIVSHLVNLPKIINASLLITPQKQNTQNIRSNNSVSQKQQQLPQQLQQQQKQWEMNSNQLSSKQPFAIQSIQFNTPDKLNSLANSHQVSTEKVMKSSDRNHIPSDQSLQSNQNQNPQHQINQQTQIMNEFRINKDLQGSINTNNKGIGQDINLLNNSASISPFSAISQLKEHLNPQITSNIENFINGSYLNTTPDIKTWRGWTEESSFLQQQQQQQQQIGKINQDNLSQAERSINGLQDQIIAQKSEIVIDKQAKLSISPIQVSKKAEQIIEQDDDSFSNEKHNYRKQFSLNEQKNDEKFQNKGDLFTPNQSSKYCDSSCTAQNYLMQQSNLQQQQRQQQHQSLEQEQQYQIQQQQEQFQKDQSLDSNQDNSKTINEASLLHFHSHSPNQFKIPVSFSPLPIKQQGISFTDETDISTQIANNINKRAEINDQQSDNKIRRFTLKIDSINNTVKNIEENTNLKQNQALRKIEDIQGILNLTQEGDSRFNPNNSSYNHQRNGSNCIQDNDEEAEVEQFQQDKSSIRIDGEKRPRIKIFHNKLEHIKLGQSYFNNTQGQTQNNSQNTTLGATSDLILYKFDENLNALIPVMIDHEDTSTFMQSQILNKTNNDNRSVFTLHSDQKKNTSYSQYPSSQSTYQQPQTDRQHSGQKLNDSLSKSIDRSLNLSSQKPRHQNQRSFIQQQSSGEKSSRNHSSSRKTVQTYQQLHQLKKQISATKPSFSLTSSSKKKLQN